MSEESGGIVRGVRYPVPSSGVRAGGRRILEERWFVRFPALYRLFAEAWMRLPLRFRVRRLFFARLVIRACAAANRRDFDLLVVGVDPGIEYHPAGDLTPLDWDAVAHGRDGYRQVWREMIDTFDDFRAEPVEFLDLGDQLLTTAHYKGRGSASGVPIDETLFQLARFRRGLVIWQHDFSDRSEALEAAGLSE